MPTPTQQTDYGTRIPALLTSRYASAPNVSGLAAALVSQAQVLENAIFGLLNTIANTFANGPPSGGPWDFIDKLGAIVGITRDGRDDADFWAAIQLQIAINTSDGRPNDILNIVNLVAGPSSPGYFESPYGGMVAAFEIDLFGTTSSVALALVQYLGKARPAAVRGTLVYTLTGSPPIVVWDATPATGGPLATAAGFSDSTSSTINTVLAAVQPL